MSMGAHLLNFSTPKFYAGDSDRGIRSWNSAARLAALDFSTLTSLGLEAMFFPLADPDIVQAQHFLSWFGFAASQRLLEKKPTRKTSSRFPSLPSS